MAVVVRLRRMGTTNKPFFRIVAADERTSNNGRFLETLGWYAPKQKGNKYEMDLERIEYWKGVGARTTETVASLIKKARQQEAQPSASEAGAEAPRTVRKVADLPEEIPAEPPAPAPAAQPEPASSKEEQTESEDEDTEKEVSE